ncbi:MAG: hypothetical protein QG646_1185 [Euryarchaeota archaeon]|nr:hypothetical protein [Euryarchaeota archaeon]
MEYHNIEIRHNTAEIQQDAEEEYQRRVDEQTGPSEETGIRYIGAPGGKVCKSCLEIPEEQRRSMILEIQRVAEEILKTHKIIAELSDLLKGEWYIKLQKPGIEKRLVIGKSGEEIFIGLYNYSDNIPIPDPNLVLLSQNGFWYPQRIEKKFEEVVSSFFTGAYGDYDFLNIVPENVEKFQAFQRDFAKALENQGWDKTDVKIVEKITPGN